MSNSQKSKILWLRTLTCLMLALMLSVALFATACTKKSSDKDEDDDETVVEQVDEQIIKNGNFEFVNFTKDDDGNDKIVYPVTSVNNFSRSSMSTIVGRDSNPASNYDSGIIDTKKINSDFLTFKKEQDEQLEALQAIDLKSRLNNADDEESRVLMIANNYKNTNTSGIGTAQRFTSSTTLTLEYGYAYKISVFVRTNGFANLDDENDFSLKNYDGESVNGLAGAYFGVTGSLNSSDVSPFIIKNIDTNGEWQKYSLYFEASDFADTKIKVVVGLGLGGKEVVSEYVEGYAFFDDITYEVIAVNAQSAEDVTAYNSQPVQEYSPFADNGENKTVLDSNDETNYILASDLQKDTDDTFAAKFSFVGLEALVNEFDSLADYEVKRSVSDDGKITAPETEEEWSGIFTLAQLKATTHGENKPYEEFLENYPFAATDKILMLRARTPSAFTFKLNDDYKVSPDEYYALSFFVKTSEINFGSGATLTVIDKGIAGTEKDDYQKNSFSAVDTTVYKVEEDKEDYLDGWKKFTFFIKNNSSNNKDTFFELELNFGLTDQSEDAMQYNSGWAAFTKFSYEKVSKSLYEKASSGTFVKKVELTDSTKTSDGVSIDSVMAGDKYDSSGEEKIKTQAVAPANYKGITGGTTRTGQDNPPTYNDYFNENVLSGLMDTEYIEEYKAAFDNKFDENTFENRENSRSKFLGIYNKELTSFGYISKNSTTISANSYSYIAVEVFATVGTKVYVYLTHNTYNEKYRVIDLTRPTVDGKYDEQKAELYQMVEGNGEWQTVWFFIATGDDSKTFNIELWNGARDGQANSKGLALFNFLRVETGLDSALFEANEDILEPNETSLIKFTRQPDKFYDEENGSPELDGDYKEILVYGKNSDTNTIMVNYSPIDVTVSVESDIEDDEPETEKPTATRPNIWLLLSSIILALALIAALIMVAIRKIKASITRKRVQTTTRYHSKKKHYTGKETIGEDLDIIDETKTDEQSDDLE